MPCFLPPCTDFLLAKKKKRYVIITIAILLNPIPRNSSLYQSEIPNSNKLWLFRTCSEFCMKQRHVHLKNTNIVFMKVSLLYHKVTYLSKWPCSVLAKVPLHCLPAVFLIKSRLSAMLWEFATAPESDLLLHSVDQYMPEALFCHT